MLEENVVQLIKNNFLYFTVIVTALAFTGVRNVFSALFSFIQGLVSILINGCIMLNLRFCDVRSLKLDLQTRFNSINL